MVLSPIDELIIGRGWAEAEKNQIKFVIFWRPVEAFPIIVSDFQLFPLKMHFEERKKKFFCVVVCLSLCLEVSEIFHSAVLANSAVAQSVFTAKWESFSTNCHFSENTENKTQPSPLHRGGNAKFPDWDAAWPAVSGPASLPLSFFALVAHRSP